MSIAPPPPERSLNNLVTEQWQRLDKAIIDGHPIEGRIYNIEFVIAERKRRIEAGNLPAEYDWEHDFKLAQFSHQHFISWQKFSMKSRENHLEYWRDKTSFMQQHAEKIIIAGFSSIILVHGAVAIGALNLISSKTPIQQSALYAAYWAIPFSLAGIFLVTLGQLANTYYIGKVIGTIGARLSFNPPERKLRGFHRYMIRLNKGFRLAERLIYASIFWFFIYASILYIILLGA